LDYEGLTLNNVPRIGRVLDAIGLVLFLGGGGAVAWAWAGFQSYVPPSDAPAWSAVEIANGYWRIQKIGVGVMLAGIAVFVLAWWVARRAVTPESATTPESPGPV
jgi:small-conductance mechanosensitive channel